MTRIPLPIAGAARIPSVLAVAAWLVLTACTSQGTPTAASPSAPPSGSPAPPASGSASAAPTGVPPTGASGAPAPTPSGAAPAPGGSGRCTAAVLRGTVRPRDAAAGNRYADLVVTNTGAVPCTLYGYGGLQLLDAAGHPLPTTALRDEPPGPALVTVAPHATAEKLLHWGVVPTGNEPADRPCQPTPARLSIIPPDETQPFTVTWDLGPVCAAGTIHGSAYHAP